MVTLTDPPHSRRATAPHLIVLVLVLVGGMIAVVLRRPDSVLNAQFWAEDGTIFFANAYNLGFRSLWLPYSGYLNVVSQAVALAALLVPLRLAPLVMNLGAIAIQSLPPLLFLSGRFARVPVGLRWAAVILYLGLPNASEIHATITNVQWTLGLLAILVTLADVPSTRTWRVFDTTVLVLLSVDGPLGILLIPFVVVVWWNRGRRRLPSNLLALIPGAILQTSVLLSSSHVTVPAGATMRRLVSTLARQLFAPSLVGLDTVRQHLSILSFPVELGLVVGGLAIVAFALARGPFELKMLIAFGATVMAAGLWRPLLTAPAPPWQVFATFPGSANRYFFLAEIAFLSSLVWTVWSGASPRVIRACAIPLLLLLPIGIIRDWRYPPLADLRFDREAARFERAPAGSMLVIPVNPPGWTMQLRKR